MRSRFTTRSVAHAGRWKTKIKEQQLGLFADRTSCSDWWANQFRLLLSSAAYVLMETIRRVGLAGTELPRAQVTTIRLKLLKIGTVILRNCPRRGPAASAPRLGVALARMAVAPHPAGLHHQDVFDTALARLSTAGKSVVLSPAPQKQTGDGGSVFTRRKTRPETAESPRDGPKSGRPHGNHPGMKYAG